MMQLKEHACARVNQVMDYARSRGCRHARIADYFGEEGVPRTCSSCDNCLDPKSIETLTVAPADVEAAVACVTRKSPSNTNNLFRLYCVAMSDQESNVTAAAKANQDTVSRFYQAFQARDAEAMNACYAPDIKFSDPVFGPLEGDRARAMWQMLNRPGGGGLALQYQVGAVDVSAGNATWQAQYAAPGTGRPVDNHITSKFWFADGLIARQEDTFDLWRWASMALGPVGRLLGWTPMVQGQIRKGAATNLDKFIKDPTAPMT